jgi:cupin fold WbuC family metalloprotein
MIKIDQSLLEKITKESIDSARDRKNYNFHQSYDEKINRMLNALQPGTYVQPHKHENPDKLEIFLILKGKLAVIEFDELGKITDYYIIEAGSNHFGVEIAPKMWHTIIPLEKGTVIYEIKEGPYSSLNDKNFAPWAPKEGDTDCKAFNDNILQEIGIIPKVKK